MQKKLIIYQISLFTILFSLSCSKEEDEIYYSINGIPYPKGIKVIDQATLNDCTLPWCASDRITRLELNDVVGILRLDSILQIGFTSDSYIEFHICNKSSIDFNFGSAEHQKVKFSGTARDACGYLFNGYPFEEEYFISVTKLELF